MTRRERVIATLNHRATDLVPYFFECTQQELDKIVAYTGDADFENKQGNYLHYTQYWGWPTELKEMPEHFKDTFGVIWNRSGADKDIGMIDKPIIEDLEKANYIFPVVDETRLRQEYDKLMTTKEDKFVMGGIGFSMFERSWSLCGLEDVMINMISCPEVLEGLYDAICEYNLKVLDIILEYDVDGVYFGDDWGQQKGLIMGPAHWRRFIKPRMERMYSKVKSKGKYVIQHSCGDISEILPDLIEIGLDCYQTVQPEVYNLRETKEKFGHKLTFWGTISTQRILPHGTPEEVKQETIRIMKQMKEGGGYIAAPTHAVPGDVPVENILAMLEVFKNQERYL